MNIYKVLFLLFRGLFVSRSDLILGNPALRRQLTIQQRIIKRPKLKNKDRIFWSWISQIWPDWKPNLIIEKPEEGKVVSIPKVGGLHHLYKRVA
jgi:hypothetical protein